MSFYVARQYENLNQIEYWTNKFVGPRSMCNPIVTLDSAEAEVWPTEEKALAAIYDYDARMLKQGFRAVPALSAPDFRADILPAPEDAS